MAYEDPRDVQTRKAREAEEQERYRESRTGAPGQRAKQKKNIADQKAQAKAIQKHGQSGAPTIMLQAPSSQPKLLDTISQFVDKYDNEVLTVMDGVKDYTDYAGAIGQGAAKYSNNGVFGWAESGKLKYYPGKNG